MLHVTVSIPAGRVVLVVILLYSVQLKGTLWVVGVDSFLQDGSTSNRVAANRSKNLALVFIRQYLFCYWIEFLISCD
jgi:hypothetical protein